MNERAITAFLARLEEGLGPVADAYRRRAIEETSDHISDRIAALERGGATRGDAVAAALLQFGSAEDVGAQLREEAGLFERLRHPTAWRTAIALPLAPGLSVAAWAAFFLGQFSLAALDGMPLVSGLCEQTARAGCGTGYVQRTEDLVWVGVALVVATLLIGAAAVAWSYARRRAGLDAAWGWRLRAPLARSIEG